MVFVYLFFALFLNATANILMKRGALGLDQGILGLFTHPLTLFKHSDLLLGIVCFVFALLFYTLVLMKLNLSVAYPLMTSLGFLIVIGYSFFFFGESFYWYQLLGVAFILLGVALVSFGIRSL